MFQRVQCGALLLFTLSVLNCELLPSLDLKPTGHVSFKNETESKTDFNIFSFYVKLGSVSKEKQHIISIRSLSRNEQFIRLSLIQKKLSVLANLRDPPVNRWFMIGEELVPNEVYYIEVNQNGTRISMTINNITEDETLESVEDFIFPAEIHIGQMGSSGTMGINGSIAGLTYNGVSTLHSYLRRDDDFRNVAVELGGEVMVREKDWVTIDERNNRYCPHTNHFPKSVVGTEILTDSCQQNIARAVCGENQIWLIEKCGGEDGKFVRNRPENPKDKNNGEDGFPRSYLIICIAAGTGAIVLITIIIVAVLVRRKRRHRVHRYEMTKALDYHHHDCHQNDYRHNDYNNSNFPHRLQGISTLPVLKHESLTAHIHPARPNSLEMSCSTLDNPGSEIMGSRVPVFTASTNPLTKPNTSDLYPSYLTSEVGNDDRDSDIISTILGERVERNYSNQIYNGTHLMPSTLLNSNSVLASEHNWQDV